MLFLFLLVFSFGGVQAQPDGARLPWKMELLKKRASAYESTAFHDRLIMARNDSYKVTLSFEEEGYCYIVRENDEGRLPLVYRKNVSGGESITLPEDGSDFRAGDLIGTSRLYVIFSPVPMQHLTKLMEQHESETPTVSLDRSLLSEVLAIRRSEPSMVITVTVRVQ